MGLIAWRSFQEQQQILLLKITTNGAVKFMSLMQDCKVTYLYCPGGKPTYVQVSILFTHYFMQYQ